MSGEFFCTTAVNFLHVNSALHPSGIAKSSTSFGWGKGGNVTSAGWQVTLCDPRWHVSSRSGVATLRTAIHLLLTYLLHQSLNHRVSQAAEYWLRDELYRRCILTIRNTGIITKLNHHMGICTFETRQLVEKNTTQHESVRKIITNDRVNLFFNCNQHFVNFNFQTVTLFPSAV